MLALKENNPEVYKNLSEGYFVIRRNDRTWAGLSPDLVIEQVLMRALKSTGGGGLTRGTGFNETQRAIWLLSTPVTSAYNLKMQELTNTHFETSKQHKGLLVIKIIQKRFYHFCDKFHHLSLQQD